jgi:hypothetical protein
MARIRTIKPEFWQDEKLQPLTDTARLLFLGLISLADDTGRLVYNPKLIEALLFDPDGPDRSRDVRESLATLSRIGRVVVGTTASGQRVLQIANWTKHQKVDKPNLAAALPEIVTTDEVTLIRETFANDSREIRDGFATHTNDLRPTTKDPRPASSEPREAALLLAAGSRSARLVAMANRGITEKYGEQPRPIRHSHSSVDDTLAAWDAAGVPEEFAARQVFERARTLTLDRPPTTLLYFRAAVIEAWEAEQAHRAAATVSVPDGAGGTSVVDIGTAADVAYRRSAVRYAKAGSVEYQDECRALGIDWEAA